MSNPSPDYGLNFTNITLDHNKPMSLVDHAEKFLRDQIYDPTYKYKLEAAELWAIKNDDTYKLLCTHPDIYTILESEFVLYDYKAILVHTTGWAAPIPLDHSINVPPSQNPERRRIALVCCVGDGDSVVDSASAFAFEDETNIVTDSGDATGSLAEALTKFWQKNSSPF